eukprot:Clim_evm24s153 gene=Clim_evmTU24s153
MPFDGSESRPNMTSQRSSDDEDSAPHTKRARTAETAHVAADAIAQQGDAGNLSESSTDRSVDDSLKLKEPPLQKHKTVADRFMDSTDQGYMAGASAQGEGQMDSGSGDDDSSDEESQDDDSGDTGPSINFEGNPFRWLLMQKQAGMSALDVMTMLNMGISGVQDLSSVDDDQLWNILAEYFMMMTRNRRRERLQQYSKLEDAVELLRNSRKIIVVTGAGVSVSCGIPDFRSKNGVYARLHVEYPDLPNPEAMFDIRFFRKDQRPFFKFAREIFPGQFRPSPCHYFLRLLERKGKLRRNYTQNIDTLEEVAGMQRVLHCHGSFRTATCMRCKMTVDGMDIKEDIFMQNIPYCQVCTGDDIANDGMPHIGDSTTIDAAALMTGFEEPPAPIMKPDIVFFHEPLPRAFHDAIEEDREGVDLIIVIGSSLKVQPVASIPSTVPHDVPQILINREPLPHKVFDIELLGNCDTIIKELVAQLGWNDDFQKLLSDTHIPAHLTRQDASEGDTSLESARTGPAKSLDTMAEIGSPASSSADVGTRHGPNVPTHTSFVRDAPTESPPATGPPMGSHSQCALQQPNTNTAASSATAATRTGPHHPGNESKADETSEPSNVLADERKNDDNNDSTPDPPRLLIHGLTCNYEFMEPNRHIFEAAELDNHFFSSHSEDEDSDDDPNESSYEGPKQRPQKANGNSGIQPEGDADEDSSDRNPTTGKPPLDTTNPKSNIDYDNSGSLDPTEALKTMNTRNSSHDSASHTSQ